MSQMKLVLKKAGFHKAFQASGSLILDGRSYRVISGGFKKGALPTGIYRVKIRHVVDGGLKKGFKIGETQFFIPIEAMFKSTRSGLGIHPDGSPKGTKGCIGIQAADAKQFWEHWMKLPLNSRPNRLEVYWSKATTLRA